MRILVLSPRPCLPTNTGAKLREFHTLRQLSRHASLHLIAFHTDSPFSLDFASVSSFPRPHRYTAAKVLRSLSGRVPLSILNYRCPHFAAAVAHQLSTQSFDFIWFESIHMAAYMPEVLEHGPLIPQVWNWHNIESELLLRYANQTPNPLLRTFARYTARQLARFEQQILLPAASLHLICSQREVDQLTASHPGARLALLPNGVDLPSFQPAPLATSQTILFVGSLDYGPNINGLLYFAREVWPLVHARHPQARLEIVGSNPVESIRQLGSLPGVHLAGQVPEVVPYYATARLAIVPLFSGGGTRLKILEAFAAGVPVVSTDLGIEGIDATSGVHYLPANSTPVWVETVSQLLTDSSAANALASTARSLVSQRYDWSILCQHLPQWLASTKASAPLP